MGDSVSHPSHYASGEIECKDAMREAMTGADIAFVATIDGVPRYKGITPMAHYWWGCAFKYLWRWARKNGLEDLRKCKQCIEYMIDEMEGQDG